ncbi:MAG: N-acetylmuramoyl-L-alanine amidase [Bacilli bacterium]
MSKSYILLLFLIGLFTLGIVKANTLPLLNKVIYIDPGHGGIDPGAIYKDLKEADLNLKISLKLQETLEKNGATVYLTRYGDYDLAVNNALQRKRSDLSRRANIINKSQADMYLSIHLNADISTSWFGAQVFYDNVNNQNAIIANYLQKELSNKLNTKRKDKKILDQYMYKRIKVKGVLIEAGFISNANERYLLKQDKYQLKLANTIKDGIINYFSNC